MTKPLHYLACPIKHENKSIVASRYLTMRGVQIRLMRAGFHVYSPIGHHFDLKEDLPTTWEFWEAPSYAFLDRCDVLIVCKLDGWQQSEGVRHETERAKVHGKTIMWVEVPVTIDDGALVCDVIEFGHSWAGKFSNPSAYKIK